MAERLTSWKSLVHALKTTDLSQRKHFPSMKNAMDNAVKVIVENGFDAAVIDQLTDAIRTSVFSEKLSKYFGIPFLNDACFFVGLRTLVVSRWSEDVLREILQLVDNGLSQIEEYPGQFISKLAAE